MKTVREIVSDYMMRPQYECNRCVAYYQEMQDNGHADQVLSFLIKGDAVLGQQGATWQECLRRFATCECSDFNDAQGVYAGRHITYFYNGQQVYSTTSYSLFN